MDVSADANRNGLKICQPSPTCPTDSDHWGGMNVREMDDGWPPDAIAPAEMTPCAICGGFDVWRSAAGDLFGKTPGSWRCLACDPPRINPRGEGVTE